jgi:hypothetical protein
MSHANLLIPFGGKTMKTILSTSTKSMMTRILTKACTKMWKRRNSYIKVLPFNILLEPLILVVRESRACLRMIPTTQQLFSVHVASKSSYDLLHLETDNVSSPWLKFDTALVLPVLHFAINSRSRI